MTDQPGRNELCSCGSGKKMKNCHPNGYGKVSKNRNILLIGIGVAVVAVTAVAMMRPDQGAPTGPARQMPGPAGRTSTQSPAMPNNQGTPGTPQPPGPAPEGKVWSVEHGHWHDAPAAGTTAGSVTAGAQSGRDVSQMVQIPAPQGANQQAKANTPEPPGPAPEGKVWSPEHGHYHDAPKTPPATPAATPGTPPK